MPIEPKTLIERLRNPQWDLVGRQGRLNVETALKTMKEAASRLELLSGITEGRLDGQRISRPSYAESLKQAFLKAADLFQQPGDYIQQVEEILSEALDAKRPKAGDWLQIRGNGLTGIEARVSTGGTGWILIELTEVQRKWLVALANSDPEGRDRGCA